MEKELEVVSYIKKHGLDELKSKFCIGSSEHPKYPNLIMLKYGIDFPRGEVIAEQCRGIILDKANNWKVVNYTYPKFYNVEESKAAPIDWSNARVFEKLDGSIIQMYWYDNQWHFATSGTPDADCSAHSNLIKFIELVQQAWNHNGYILPGEEWKDYCFAFELITKWNRIVVQHDAEPKLILHGVRRKTDLKEFPPEHVEHLGFKIVGTHQLNSKEEALAHVAKLNGLESEGLVICDANFNRIKVKAPHYVTLHHMRGEYFNDKRALEIILHGEVDEVTTYFPEFKEEIKIVSDKLDDICKQTREAYNKIKHIESQKEFALALGDAKYKSLVFSMKKGVEPEVSLRSILPATLLRMVREDK